jgi:hypothetical protein
MSFEQQCQLSSLRKCPTIANLPEANIILAAQRMKIHKYAAGETIIRKGDEGKDFFMIKMGTVGFSVQDDGTVQSTRGEGDFFGELALLQSDCVRTATAVAVSEVECFVLSRDAFNALLPDAVPAGEWRADAESLDQLRSCFRLFDKDGDGGISAEELKNVSCNLGEQTSYEMAQEMVAMVDTDGDGQVGFDEFVLLMTGQPLPEVVPHITTSAADEEAAEVRRLFDEADTSNSGKLNGAGMAQLVTQLCERQLLPDIRKRLRNNRAEVMDEINPDGEGNCVTFPQVRMWMQAMNRHWTDLLVLPEGLVFAIRADAAGRCQLPKAAGAESRWKRLGILLWLMSAHQKLWGDVRQLYGQSAEVEEQTGFSNQRLANTAPKRDADGVFSSWQEDLTVRIFCHHIEMNQVDSWVPGLIRLDGTVHTLNPTADGVCTHLSHRTAWCRSSILPNRSRGIELAFSRRIQRIARPGTVPVS